MFLTNDAKWYTTAEYLISVHQEPDHALNYQRTSEPGLEGI